MRLARLLRTTYAKASFAYALLFALSLGVIFAGTYLAVRHEMRATLIESISDDAGEMLSEYRTGGFSGLQEAVGERLAENPDNMRVYALMDASGKLVGGNLKRMPDAATDYEGMLTLLFPYQSKPNGRDEIDLPALVKITREPGAVLAVGRITEDMDDTLQMIIACFLFGIAGSLLVAIAGSLFFGSLVARRISSMSATVRAIVSGQLDSRIPLRSSDDEFDRLSADVNRMLDRIEDLMQNVRQISNDIAHDLRTPLTRLRQALEHALGPRVAGSAELRAGIRHAIAEADTIIETFNALLRIAEVESGARKRNFKTVDIAGLLVNLGDIYRPVAEESKLTFSCRLQGRISVRGDRELLTQLFANLIENAIRYAPSGGDRLDIRLSANSGFVDVIIEDNGPGIPEGEREKVFRRLYRLERSRTTPGTGLGLSLAKAIAEMHDGAIALKDGRPGLRAIVRLPLIASDVQPVSAAAAAVAAQLLEN